MAVRVGEGVGVGLGLGVGRRGSEKGEKQKLHQAAREMQKLCHSGNDICLIIKVLQLGTPTENMNMQIFERLWTVKLLTKYFVVDKLLNR